jgi:hypothetical protein
MTTKPHEPFLAQKLAWATAASPDARFAGILALAVGLLGLWPHLRFSIHVGHLAWFKGAFDEDTYALFPFGVGQPRLDRVGSGLVMWMLSRLCGGSIDGPLILADLLLPALATMSAYVLSSVLVTSRPGRALVALLLVFGADLLSLGNAAVFMGSPVSLDAFRALVGPAAETLVPAYETSYLTIFRTSEPQVTYIVAFAALAGLVQILRRRVDVSHRGMWFFLLAIHLILVSTYVFVTMLVVGIELLVGALLRVEGRSREGRVLWIVGGTTLAVMAIGTVVKTGDNSGFLFESHLPSLTPSVVASLLATGLAAWQLCRARGRNPALWLGATLVAAPVVLLNQQVLTGVMVSARDWERYACYPLLVCGCALLASETLSARRDQMPWWLHLSFDTVTATAVMLIGWTLVAAQGRAYDMWLRTNQNSVAIVNALRNIEVELGRPLLLVLDEPGLAPLVAVRRGGQRESLLDHTDTFLTRVPRLERSTFALTALSEPLFEYWRRGHVSPARAAEILDAEIAARNGTALPFLFHQCDYWYPCSDSRDLQLEGIRSHVPAIVQAYAESLEQPSTRYASRRALFVAEESSPTAAAFAAAGPLAASTVASVNIHVYDLP